MSDEPNRSPATRMDLAGELTRDLGMTRSEITGWTMYQRWCQTNGLIVVPLQADAERVVVRFLHSSWEVRHWGATTTTEYIRGICKQLGAAGVHVSGTDSGLIAQWIMSLRRFDDGKQKSVRTEEIPDELLVEAVARAVLELPDDVVRLRAVVAVAHAMGVDPSYASCQYLPRDSFLIRDDGSVIVTENNGRRHVLDATRDAEMTGAVRLALSRLEGDQPLHPSTSRSDTALRRPVTEDQRLIRLAWERAAAGASRVRLTASTWRDAFERSTHEDHLWLMRCIDPSYFGRVQDRAYLLVGCVTAHRHATMARLRIDQMESLATGYCYDVEPNQHKAGRAAARKGSRADPVHKEIDHLNDDPTVCGVVCPACALADLLALRLRKGASPADPVFATFSNGSFLGPLARQCATIRLRAFLGFNLSDKAGRAFGTRALRVSATTKARRRMSALQTAATVTNVKKPSTMEIYDRSGAGVSFPVEYGVFSVHSDDWNSRGDLRGLATAPPLSGLPASGESD